MSRKSDTWVILWYDQEENLWFSTSTRYPSRGVAAQVAECAVGLNRRPFYIWSSHELDTIGLPEGPPPDDKARRRRR